MSEVSELRDRWVNASLSEGRTSKGVVTLDPQTLIHIMNGVDRGYQALVANHTPETWRPAIEETLKGHPQAQIVLNGLRRIEHTIYPVPTFTMLS